MSSHAREAALYAYQRCRRDGAWSVIIIDSAIEKYSLDKRDASFCAFLVRSVLENTTLCDFYIAHYCNSPLKRLEPKVLDILRLSVCQMLFMDKVPARAAVSEGVELSRSEGYQKASGLINAVLRRISENINNLPKIPGEGTPEYLSIKYSQPLWLTEKLCLQYDYDFVEGFLISCNMAPSVFLQVNTLKTSTEELFKKLSDCGYRCSLVSWLKDCISLEDSGKIEKLPGFNEGLFYVQDPAAKASIFLSEIETGMSVLDVCAAPGGKSFAAALKMNGIGNISSCDIHDKKTQMIAESAKRLGIEIISIKTRDARVNETLEFDAVIADVPCSGIGVMRKKPEIRNKTLDSIKKLPEIQLDILNSCSKSVKTGGILIYSTCTVLKEENEEVVELFLSQNPNFEKIGFDIKDKTTDGCYTFWPHIDGTDGFFVCQMKKKN